MVRAATIVALASAAGRSGVAVLRLSGPRLADFAQALCGLRPLARHAHLVSFRNRTGEVLDQGLLLWFPAPHSYTGEDVLELHTHGGEVLPRRVLRACLALGARLAEPGEFTRRAFEHGKLDLAQAEAVGDLIEASGEAAARGALRSLTGEFSRQVRALQVDLTHIRIQVEGALDFPEEALPLAAQEALQTAIEALAESVRQVLTEARRSTVLRSGRQVVLLGAPNVGKSSLLNRLAADDLAIVSPEAGTTRDTVRTAIELGGVRLELVDTAGVRDGAQAVEKLGIERTWAAVAQADLVIRLWSCDEPARRPPGPIPAGVAVLDVWNKCDLLGVADVQRLVAEHGQEAPAGALALAVSAHTGQGLAELEAAVLAALGWSAGVEPAFLARERHVAALEGTLEHLRRAARRGGGDALLADDGLVRATAQGEEEIGLGEELVAEELRLAQQGLDSLLGQFAADDLLGEIFARFCIGK